MDTDAHQLPLFDRRRERTGNPLSELEYRKVGVFRDVEWVGAELPPNTATKTLWRCKICGHEWMAIYGSVANAKTGCPPCGEARRTPIQVTMADYEAVERETGYKWLDRAVVRANDKSRWQCHKCEHIWTPSLVQLRSNGNGCPECAKKVIGDKARLSAEDYHAVAREKGALWLGEEVPRTNKALTTWQCSEGHICERNYTVMKKSKYGCPQCGASGRTDALRLKRKDYINGALDRDIQWGGDKLPKNNREKTFWQCPEGHTWKAPYHDVVDNESGCPYCANNTPVTLEDYEGIERERGYKWLDRIVVRSHDKSRWQCHVCGNIWATSLYLLRIKGHGCPECGKLVAVEKLRHSIEDYHDLAQERGAVWLGDSLAEGVEEPTLWECDNCGSISERTYKAMKRSPHPCNQCSFNLRNVNVRLKRDDYITTALDRGIRWMGEEVPRSRQTKTLWQCPEGHTWNTTRATIARGRSCPVCKHYVNGHRTSAPQRELAEILDGELNVRIGRQSVDVAIERQGHKIAIEYDGWHWHGSEKAQAYDKRKYKRVMSLGWKLIRICSANLLPSIERLERAISEAIEVGYAEITLEDWGIGTVFDPDKSA